MTASRSKKSRSTKPRNDPVETLHFEDGDRVRLLAGAGDRHLIMIEEEIGVRLAAPGGGQIQISGAEPRTRLEAKRIINRLYTRALSAH